MGTIRSEEKQYGVLTVGSRLDGSRKTVTAHRYSYEAYKGSIPKGLLVCHKCDVQSCVNPDHLFLGTHKDNTQDMLRKGRNKCKLTWDLVLYIRENLKKRGDGSRLAIELGVNHKTISDIKIGKSWISPPKEEV